MRVRRRLEVAVTVGALAAAIALLALEAPRAETGAVVAGAETGSGSGRGS